MCRRIEWSWKVSRRKCSGWRWSRSVKRKWIDYVGGWREIIWRREYRGNVICGWINVICRWRIVICGWWIVVGGWGIEFCGWGIIGWRIVRSRRRIKDWRCLVLGRNISEWRKLRIFLCKFLSLNV